MNNSPIPLPAKNDTTDVKIEKLTHFCMILLDNIDALSERVNNLEADYDDVPCYEEVFK